MTKIKGWAWGVIGAGSTAIVGLVGAWILNTFEKGIEATERDQIESVVSEMVLTEDDIKKILQETLVTADGRTYGEVLVSTKEDVLVLQNDVDRLTRAVEILTDE